jgi:hypothetical protein
MTDLHQVQQEAEDATSSWFVRLSVGACEAELLEDSIMVLVTLTLTPVGRRI